MHFYGCRAYPLRFKILRKNKLEPRAMIDYLMSYDFTNIFRIWVLSRNKMIRTKDVIFDHTRFYDPEELNLAHLLTVPISTIVEVVEFSKNLPSTFNESIVEENADDIFETEKNQKIEDFADAPEISKNAKNADSAENPSISEQNFEKKPEIIQIFTPKATSDFTTDPDLAQGGQNVFEATPNAFNNQSSDQLLAPNRKRRRIIEVSSDSIVMNTRFKKQVYAVVLIIITDLIPYFSVFVEGILQKQPGIKWRFHRDSLPAEPRYWQQMLRHRFAKEFQLTAVKKISELKNRGIYQLIEKKNQPKLPLIWVFKYKFDTDGYLQKFKTRLCVRGDLQITNEETYAVTLTARIFRAIMTIAAAFDLEIHQFDAINAFVNSKLNDEMICEFFEGFRQPEKCWKLLRALYDFKQAPMLWYKELIIILKKLRLISMLGVHCFYANDSLIFFFYVDDIVMLNVKQNIDQLIKFETTLLMKFQMRALDDLNWFLSIRIIRNRDARKIWLCQNSYISKMTARFNLKATKNFNIPLSEIPKQRNENDQLIEQMIYAYQQRIDSLNFAAVISRPNIAFAVFRLSQFLQKLSKENVAATDRVIFYFHSTKNLAIEYSKHQNSNIFACASDFAFEDDLVTRRNSDGYLFHLYEKTIDWKTIKQITVITFSIEAELLAISKTAKKIIWWKRFFEAIRFDTDETLQIKCDNRQTIRILTKKIMKLDTKLRHVDIHQHWLRQKVQNGRINVSWMLTNEMSADGLTKHLPRQKHEVFLKQLNLVDITDRLIK